MNNYKSSTRFSLILVISILVISCTTYAYNRKDPYPNMEIVNYGNSQAYIFKNEISNKLLIIIEGSGWNSVLGVKEENEWSDTGVGAQLLQVLGDTHTIMIPEKLNRQPGQNYFNDMEDRASYTFNNLLDCYIESINGYMTKHPFSSIVIFGVSEGAGLLPLVFEKLNSKDRVKALVSMGFGGFSWYESIFLLSKDQNISDDYKVMYQYLADTYAPGIDSHPDMYREDLFGSTYRWFNSFKDIRPFDYYENINIPILFIHGDADYNIPVESTIYIQENLPDKPFNYKYFPWEHQPRKDRDIIQWRKELAEWIREHS